MIEFKDLCFECGMDEYKLSNRDILNGVTVSKGLCPQCAMRTGIIPAEDWRRAVEGIKNGEDWD
jgi:protein-arginine kinase activator protein McsA